MSSHNKLARRDPNRLVYHYRLLYQQLERLLPDLSDPWRQWAAERIVELEQTIEMLRQFQD